MPLLSTAVFLSNNAQSVQMIDATQPKTIPAFVPIHIKHSLETIISYLQCTSAVPELSINVNSMDTTWAVENSDISVLDSLLSSQPPDSTPQTELPQIQTDIKLNRKKILSILYMYI